MKEKIARWYKLGLWNEAMIQHAVDKGTITEDDAIEILNK